MDRILVPALIVGLAVYGVCLLVFLRRKSLRRNILFCITFIYGAAVLFSCLQMTLFQPHMRTMPMTAETVAEAFRQIGWIPLQNLFGSISRIIREHQWNHLFYVLVQPIALLMPLGILLPLLFPRMKTGRMVLTAFVVPLAIELLQLWENLTFRFHWVSIDDVLLEAVGCLLAYGVFALARRQYRR